MLTTTITKISEVANKIPDHAKYITTQEFTDSANIGPVEVLKTSPPTSPGRPLKILFDRPGDISI